MSRVAYQWWAKPVFIILLFSSLFYDDENNGYLLNVMVVTNALFVKLSLRDSFDFAELEFK